MEGWSLKSPWASSRGGLRQSALGRMRQRAIRKLRQSSGPGCLGCQTRAIDWGALAGPGGWEPNGREGGQEEEQDEEENVRDS